MRGKASKRIDGAVTLRITPAYAGKSCCENARLCGGQDHPRLCGEKQATCGRSSRSTGSPPPMRGKVQQLSDCFRFFGITPAYAGKRQSPPTRYSLPTDHPRLCGEKGEKVGDAIGGAGSPPPMRGKESFCERGLHQNRITPAYAGKRQTVISNDVAKRDHPRLCGEKRKAAYLTFWHVWITPAYAGKRDRGIPRLRQSWDHPRLCGEKPTRRTRFRKI